MSDKELARNEAVYGLQKNRNPFIDHPDLAEHIWGNKKSDKWTADGQAATSIIQPADGSYGRFRCHSQAHACITQHKPPKPMERPRM